MRHSAPCWRGSVAEDQGNVMSFVKLDCGLLQSSLWLDHEARIVFITALLMAEPFETREFMAQIDTNELKETGWEVPPGWYGFVAAAGVGIVRQSGVDFDLGMKALVRLASKDPDSRSSAYEGRRLVRVDGGYLVLNYDKYRERDYTNAERQRRWRESHKGNALPNDSNEVLDNNALRNDDITARNTSRSRSRSQKQKEITAAAAAAAQITPILCILNSRRAATRSKAGDSIIPEWEALVRDRGLTLDRLGDLLDELDHEDRWPSGVDALLAAGGPTPLLKGTIT